MIGRGAIRNPWLFDQIRQVRQGGPPRLPSGRDVLQYIHELWDAQVTDDAPEHLHVQRMKKFMNFIGEGVGSGRDFLFEIRRVQTRCEFFSICAAYLDHAEPMTLMPGEVGAVTVAGFRG